MDRFTGIDVWRDAVRIEKHKKEPKAKLLVSFFYGSAVTVDDFITILDLFPPIRIQRKGQTVHKTTFPGIRTRSSSLCQLLRRSTTLLHAVDKTYWQSESLEKTMIFEFGHRPIVVVKCLLFIFRQARCARVLNFVSTTARRPFSFWKSELKQSFLFHTIHT